MSDQVHRVTLFKIPNEADRETLLAKYKIAKSKALKDGKPYILNVEAGHTTDDARNQGYNIVAKTTFASMQDFEYYDKECEAHKEIKGFAASVHKGAMMVYFKSVVDS